MRWKIDEAEDLPLSIIEDTPFGLEVVEIGERTSRNLEIAALIAATPELLATCKEAHALLFNGIKQELVAKLGQAIAQAEENSP